MPQNILQGVVALYRALYRKWRPRKFADVVGQEAIVTALQNQIAAGRIGHAYLFTGTRGTGKTTCAKIFAKAVNCLDTTSPDPCGECAVCKGIDEGTILDVSEIDAASNNSVDDIRDLRDETAYLPAVCKYKVYIIDEVHMLSTSAFNALLKTMEEPPEHVIFILATTEVQKVPATILSRCQRYDFQRITADKIAGRLEYVAGQENIELDHNAAELIGRLADGAMRDALSILDTCAGVSNTVDEALVRRYMETRRQHPLAKNMRIQEGIAQERKILAGIRAQADVIVDTTAMKTVDLKEYLSSRFGVDGSSTDMQVTVFSFGFKYGIPIDADTVIDVRFLPNPFYVPAYKYSTGRVKEVADYIEKAPVTKEFLAKLYDFMDFMVDRFRKAGKTQFTIAIGCTGGMHRSVFVTERLGSHLKEKFGHVNVEHRDLHRNHIEHDVTDSSEG